MKSIKEYNQTMWENYLNSIGEDIETTNKSYTAWYFCNNEKDANELAELVVSGIKKATASLYMLYKHDNEELPQIGQHSIITDWDGKAQCIIKTTNIDVVPYNKVSDEFAFKEGEGDKTLDYWRKVHWKFFFEEAKDLGLEPDEHMLVVCEEFEVVYKD